MWKLVLALSLFTSSMLSAETKVLAFSGSTRTDSINKKLVTEAGNLAKQLGATVTFIDLKDYPMPFYDGDIEKEQGMPNDAKRLRQLLIQNQVIFIASPEYNGSLSAVLKNALDWASRSEDGGSSRDAFKGKKFVLMSASPGQGGGTRGLAHLRSIIEGIGGTVISQQFVVPNAFEAFDSQGKLKNPQAGSELKQIVQQAIQ
ncbi:NADPH:quinone oxidoreductase [Parachlamydia acanthamoebae UV-7]|jgi:NAD(P)H-dependent FMN reductase|uniref:NADPH:quinone oxidoreductase n=3 Tax=Parachlamydia acanthamoebae TaxID=83552 RepID=F8L0S4_PARAV|nr:NAD(P)H-dependent oxidoreductase [Parachlamydia acanthamoebae]CCB86824.1 NADPH:quinone oxidoreductase [Parachlamydia acanthamoebae UV-7]